MSEPTRWQRFWEEWRSFAIFAACLIFFRAAIADWNLVPSGSMKPTILIGDRILVNRLAYDAKLPLTDISLMHLGDPQRGDIVTFSSPKDGERLVKRLIGLPDDTVELRDNHLFINGQEAHYRVLTPSEFAHLDWTPRSDQLVVEETVGKVTHPITVGRYNDYPFRNFGPVKVPTDNYLMLGDNRDNSADSRFFGFVPRELLIGRANTVLASLDSDHYYKPRSDRFLHTLP
jgi:signal peptidase I